VNLKKIRPPNFDGEMEEGAKSWLLNMGKYFQIYNYSGNLRARLAIYQLNGKDVIWWQETKTIKKLRETKSLGKYLRNTLNINT
jgi:hypothetical protein